MCRSDYDDDAQRSCKGLGRRKCEQGMMKDLKGGCKMGRRG